MDSNVQTSPKVRVTELIADVLEAKSTLAIKSHSDHEEEKRVKLLLRKKL